MLRNCGAPILGSAKLQYVYSSLSLVTPSVVAVSPESDIWHIWMERLMASHTRISTYTSFLSLEVDEEAAGVGVHPAAVQLGGAHLLQDLIRWSDVLQFSSVGNVLCSRSSSTTLMCANLFLVHCSVSGAMTR